MDCARANVLKVRMRPTVGDGNPDAPDALALNLLILLISAAFTGCTPTLLPRQHNKNLTTKQVRKPPGILHQTFDPLCKCVTFVVKGMEGGVPPMRTQTRYPDGRTIAVRLRESQREFQNKSWPVEKANHKRLPFVKWPLREWGGWRTRWSTRGGMCRARLWVRTASVCAARYDVDHRCTVRALQ